MSPNISLSSLPEFEFLNLNLQSISIPDYLASHLKLIAKHIHPDSCIYYLKTSPGIFHPILNHQIELIKNNLIENKGIFLLNDEWTLKILSQPAAHYILPKDIIIEDIIPNTSLNETYIHHHKGREYINIFSPIIIQNEVIGVIQLLFNSENDALKSHFRIFQAALRELCFFLKTSHLQEYIQEINRLNTYHQFLERTCSTLDYQNICFNIVNYTREISGANRVSLHILKDIIQIKDDKSVEKIWTTSVELKAISGLKKIQHKSEAAVLLSEIIHIILKAEYAQYKCLSENKLKNLIIFERYSANKNISSYSQSIDNYLMTTKYQWVGMCSLIDEDNNLYGYLLIEGFKKDPTWNLKLLQIPSIAKASTLYLKEAVKWNKKLIRKLLLTLGKFIKENDKKERINIFKKFLIGSVLFISFFWIPIPYSIKAEAIIKPAQEVSLPTIQPGLIESIFVKIGQSVRKGEPLLKINTNLLELEKQSLEEKFLESSVITNIQRTYNTDDIFLSEEKESDSILFSKSTIDYHIKNATINAPLDGVIIGPNQLKDLTGKIVEPGEILIKIANLTQWIVQANLREQDLSLIEEYMSKNNTIKAKLKLISIPNKKFTIIPLHEQFIGYGNDNTRNISQDNFSYYGRFLLEEILDSDTYLKIGYKGKVSIDVGYKTIGYHLFRDFREYLKYHF